MDTRSRKTSGFLAFLLFFVLLTGLLFTSALTVETLYSTQGHQVLYPKQMIQQSLQDLAHLLYDEPPLSGEVQEDLYYNLHYVVEQHDIYFNSDDDLKLTYDQFLQQYGSQGMMMLTWQQGETPQITYRGAYFLIDQKTITRETAEMAVSLLKLYFQEKVERLALVIDDQLAYNTPMYYSCTYFQESMNNLKICFYSSLCLFFITLAYGVFKRAPITAFNESLAQLTFNFWIEVKLGLGLVLTLMLFSLSLPLPLAVTVLFWGLYVLVNELHFYGLKPFHHNILNSAMKTVRLISGPYGYQKKWLTEFLLLVVFEVICAFILWSMMFSAFLGFMGILVFVLIFAAAFLVLFLYIRRMMLFMQDSAALAQQVENIRRGVLNESFELSEGSPLQPVSDNLEKIREGVSHQVEEQLKSEKLKIELITNVSHDLKTPITSLINYSDLLTKAEIQPEYARDYVRIITQKSVRLKNLIQDLFEISKAASGNLQMDLRKLEINGLLMQTLAELDEKIEASTLEFKIQYLDTPGYILADGGRLYNVFDNLITNAIKYSMENTRVYIQIERVEEQICISFKNIANYELKFDPGSLTERFVRGDVSRSTEGSGLGLAIAETFVTLMKGQIEVSADGDLFKIEIRFAELPQEPADFTA